MSEKKPKKDKDNIWKDITDESVKAMLKAGRIYPSLKPRLDAVYVVEVIGIPKEFDSKAYGIANSIDIIYNEMKRSIVLSKSIRQHLRVEMLREKLVNDDNEPDFNKLIGQTLTIQKTIGNTKTMKNVELYSVQIN